MLRKWADLQFISVVTLLYFRAPITPSVIMQTKTRIIAPPYLVLWISFGALIIARRQTKFLNVALILTADCVA